MNKTKVFLFALAGLFVASCVSDTIDQSQSSAEAVALKKIVNTPEDAKQGELIIFVDEATAAQLESSVDATRSGVTALDALASECGATSIKPVFNMLVNAEQKRKLDMHRWYTISFSENANIEAVAQSLSKLSEVEAVQFATRIKVPAERIPEVSLDAFQTTRSEELPFNDPMLGQQWHYNNDGTVNFPNAKAGADINLFNAWEHTAGRPDVIVAVVDEGVCHTHADLKDNMCANEAELNGTQGVDDDANGYVDDIYGYNFVDNGRVSWSKAKDSGHGTHVAGTVAAVNNNGVGCCGVAGGSGKGDGVRLISCQIISNGEAAGPNATAAAVEYAADRGASVLQNSWGFGAGQIANDSAFENGTTKVELTAFNYFMTKKKNSGDSIKYFGEFEMKNKVWME